MLSDFHHRGSLYFYSARRDLSTAGEEKKLRMSWTKRSGRSSNEKCPPRSYSFQYWMLAACTAQSRGHLRGSPISPHVDSNTHRQGQVVLTSMQLLFGVHAHSGGCGHIHFKGLLCLAATTAKRLPVESEPRSCTLDPVHHDEDDDIRIAESLVYVGPVMEFLHKPGQEFDGGVSQREAKGLRPGLLLLQVAALIRLEIAPHKERPDLKGGVG